jgi:hypothetical protein
MVEEMMRRMGLYSTHESARIEKKMPHRGQE